jgi:catechol-2,3-dioxygenase
MIRIDQIDHLALTVTSLERSTAWYGDVLGLEQRPQTGWNRPIMLCAGSTCLALFPADTAQPTPAPDYRQTIALRHFAFRVDRINFEHAQTTFRQRNIPFEFEDHGISHSIYVHDPDGYRVELTTYDLEHEYKTDITDDRS